MAARAKELGLAAAAITDHGECGGHLRFDKACRAAGVKPVFGMEGYWVWDVATTMQTRSSSNSHITLLARDQDGLRNLWALSSRAYENLQAGRRPLADLAMMRDHAKGMWASDGCLLTEFEAAARAGNEARCREIYAALAGVFGDRFFVELHTWQLVDPQTDKDRDLNARMSLLNQVKARLAQEMGLPLVAVNDNHYARPADWENHALVWEMNTHGSGDQLERGRAAGHLMADEEIVHWLGRHGISRSVTEEAIYNAGLIAGDCNVEIPKTLEMPRLTGSDADDRELFLDLVDAGFREKVVAAGLDVDRYGQRMEDEARMILAKGFAGYFNIVADYARAAKSGSYGTWIGRGQQPGMLVGPARGSAGGSLVAWLMDITGVDPLKYGLLFERFISPARQDWPDIDMDFPQSKRDEVKDYLVARHGADRVCGIGTRSTSRPKGVLADLCRVKGIDFDERMRISRIFDAAREDDWEEILKRQGSALRPYMQKYPDLFEKIGEMVGIVRQPGTHPAGVVVNNEPILGRVPTRRVKGQVTTQFDLHEVEWLGGVKDDLLGLRHLDTLEAARALIKERTGEDVDYYALGDAELRDPAIWPAVDAGDTAGVFQLETAGGTEDAMRFRPRSEVDVADLISVNRPGVIDAGLKDKYMARRAGIEPDVFDHPLMEGITGDTHGILVYQEQLMRAARVLAGFTAEEAEGLRKVIGKKQTDKLPALEGKFVAGCLANPDFTGPVGGLAEKAARKVWASINAAGRYAFNKSHAVGYALISTWEIWLKHHHGVEFLVALMQTDTANATRYARDLRRRGIQLWPPDVNLSGRKMTIDDLGVRYGLDSVRGVGAAAVDDILLQRPFVSFDDFYLRADPSLAGRKEVVENLLMVGAFDSLGDRGQLLRTLRGYHRDRSAVPDFSSVDAVAKIEKELIGHYVTADPMARYAPAIDGDCAKAAAELVDAAPGDVLKVGGQITSLRPVKVKRGREKGRDMAHMTVTWNDEDFDVAVFCDMWATTRPLLKVGAPVVCQVIRTERGCHLSTVARLDMLIDK